LYCLDIYSNDTCKRNNYEKKRKKKKTMKTCDNIFFRFCRRPFHLADKKTVLIFYYCYYFTIHGNKNEINRNSCRSIYRLLSRRALLLLLFPACRVCSYSLRRHIIATRMIDARVYFIATSLYISNRKSVSTPIYSHIDSTPRSCHIVNDLFHSLKIHVWTYNYNARTRTG